VWFSLCACRLFEPSALQLCSRSVGASSGDLRHALKACRAAVDELEQQQSTSTAAAGTAAAAGTTDSPAPKPAATVGPRLMSVALSRLAGVRSSQFGAQATSIIRSLPNQQQLLLYALSVLCQQPAQEASGSVDPMTPNKAGKVSASSLWKGAGSAAVLSSSGGSNGGSPTSSAGSWSRLKKKKGAGSSSLSRLGSSSNGQPGGQGSVFVLAVTADAAYGQYVQVCKLLKLPACAKGELLHMADLLAQMALLDIIRTPSGQAGSGSSAGCKAGLKAAGLSPGPASAFKGFKASKGGLGGLGGGSRGLLGGGGSRGGAGGLGGSPGGSAAGHQGEVKLSLRASITEVFAALKYNPALRCLVDA